MGHSIVPNRRSRSSRRMRRQANCLYSALISVASGKANSITVPSLSRTARRRQLRSTALIRVATALRSQIFLARFQRRRSTSLEVVVDERHDDFFTGNLGILSRMYAVRIRPRRLSYSCKVVLCPSRPKQGLAQYGFHPAGSGRVQVAFRRRTACRSNQSQQQNRLPFNHNRRCVMKLIRRIGLLAVVFCAFYGFASKVFPASGDCPGTTTDCVGWVPTKTHSRVSPSGTTTAALLVRRWNLPAVRRSTRSFTFPRMLGVESSPTYGMMEVAAKGSWPRPGAHRTLRPLTAIPTRQLKGSVREIVTLTRKRLHRQPDFAGMVAMLRFGECEYATSRYSI